MKVGVEMKNNRGFTLVEVLSIIAVLGVMIMLIFPNIGGSLEAKKDKELEKIINIVESAGKFYHSFNSDEYKFSIDELKEKKYRDRCRRARPLPTSLKRSCGTSRTSRYRGKLCSQKS